MPLELRLHFFHGNVVPYTELCGTGTTIRFFPLSHLQLAMITRSFLLLLLAFALLTGCTEDPVYPERVLTVSINGLPVLPADAQYNLWVSYPRDIVDSGESEYGYIGVGAFKVNESGGITGVDGGAAIFTVPQGMNPNLVNAALVSVEHLGSTSKTPGARMLSGLFNAFSIPKTAQLQLNGPDSFRNTLDTGTISPTSVFLLETPTTADGGDGVMGLWFITGDLVTRGIQLPAQPLYVPNPLWSYEAWLTHMRDDSTIEYISLGRFDDPGHADDSGPGPWAGAQRDSAYDKPGEDFTAVGHERVLNDGSYGVIVALMPDSISMSRPFVTLLQRDVIDPFTGARQAIQLNSVSAFPTVEVTLAQ
jgi:hypothetical protein